MTNDKSFTPDEAAKYLGIETRTLENWRADDKGPKFYKPTAKLIYYFQSDLDSWIKESGKDSV